MQLSTQDKNDILTGLAWNYKVSEDELLDVINGKKEKAGPFTSEKLLVRCLERVSWHRIVALWGIENILKSYTPKLLMQIHSKVLRKRYDTVFRLLRKEPLPASSWGSEYHKNLQHTFLSDRRILSVKLDKKRQALKYRSL